MWAEAKLDTTNGGGARRFLGSEAGLRPTPPTTRVTSPGPRPPTRHPSLCRAGVPGYPTLTTNLCGPRGQEQHERTTT